MTKEITQADYEWFFPDGGWHVENDTCLQIECDGPHMECSPTFEEFLKL